jgi:nucleotide-binding universal stress UspA family protein
MYKRILVAIDGSPTAECALQEALKLAKELRAQLRIVYAVDVVTLNWGDELHTPTEYWDALAQEGEEILSKAQAAARDAGITAETRLIKIDTWGRRIPEAIAEDAESWPADIIVLGTHGRRGLSRVFLGSVAEGVVRVAAKPVLLIRGT